MRSGDAQVVLAVAPAAPGGARTATARGDNAVRAQQHRLRSARFAARGSPITRPRQYVRPVQALFRSVMQLESQEGSSPAAAGSPSPAASQRIITLPAPPPLLLSTYRRVHPCAGVHMDAVVVQIVRRQQKVSDGNVQSAPQQESATAHGDAGKPKQRHRPPAAASRPRAVPAIAGTSILSRLSPKRTPRSHHPSLAFLFTARCCAALKPQQITQQLSLALELQRGRALLRRAAAACTYAAAAARRRRRDGAKRGRRAAVLDARRAAAARVALALAALLAAAADARAARDEPRVGGGVELLRQRLAAGDRGVAAGGDGARRALRLLGLLLGRVRALALGAPPLAVLPVQQWLALHRLRGRGERIEGGH